MGKVASGHTGEARDEGKERWISHYSSLHRILLVGEGDFSFSACLARAFGSASNMVATSLDSQDELSWKHSTSVGNLEELRALGCSLLHGIDVNDMHQHDVLKTIKFDRIVFNFPHAGFIPSCSEAHWMMIRRHKNLLTAFFMSAREMLSETGEVHVSHRDDYPYNEWKLEKLAHDAGLALLEMVEFRMEDYPGYVNRRSGIVDSNNTFRLKEPFTFKFSSGKCSETNNGSLRCSTRHDIDEAAEEFLDRWERRKAKANRRSKCTS